jgi:pimeloyl-ACP methyl ester carboxylesterase
LAILPFLSKTRRVIAVELQAHGRTPDIDRALTVENFADDVVELLDRLGIERADVYGWSMGAAVALRLGTDHADRVGRLAGPDDRRVPGRDLGGAMLTPRCASP